MPADGDAPRVARCPICARAAVAAFRPFCSKRCADVDLNRWLSGAYVVPGEAADDADGAPADAATSRDAPGDGDDDVASPARRPRR
jgi:hypothetical protein